MIALLDDRAAKKDIRAAEIELANAKRDLATGLVKTTPAPSPVVPPPTDTASAEVALKTAYDAGYTSVSDTLVFLPWISDGISSILYGMDVSPSGTQENMYAYADMVKQPFPDVSRYREIAATDFNKAREAYLKTKTLYEGVSRTSSPQQIEALINETNATLQEQAQSLKSTNQFLAFVKQGLTDQNRAVPPHLTESLRGISERIQTTNDSLESVRNSLTNVREAREFLAEKQRENAQKPPVQEQPAAVDPQPLQTRVREAERSLAEAKLDLAKLDVRTPVAGKISSIDVRAGKAVVDGEVLAVLVSPDNIAKIALTEAEVGKVYIGQKAFVTFDAVEGLAVEGRVIKVDSRASVANGAVTFFAYVGFTGDASKVRHGMTVSAHLAMN